MAIKMSPIKNSEVKDGKVKVKKPWYDKILMVLFILSCIALIIGVFYTLSPLVGFIAGFFLMLLGVVLVLLSVCTIFIIWASPSYRNAVSKLFTTGAKIFNKSIEFKDIVANPYPIIMSVCGAVILAFLITSIILFIKKDKEDIHHDHKYKMITAIVISVLFIVCLIASFVLLFKTNL